MSPMKIAGVSAIVLALFLCVSTDSVSAADLKMKFSVPKIN
ncbi:MAG: hypothetical protein WA610_03180 [Thermodesulfovibrionales bacterium]